MDLSNLTWEQLAEIVLAIRKEAKRRNPIGINMYVPYLEAGAAALREIAAGEKDNPTSEG